MRVIQRLNQISPEELQCIWPLLAGQMQTV